jgi:hypothetical protein
LESYRKKGETEQKFPQRLWFTTLNPEPWVSFDGRGAILFNRWQTYTLNFGNKGNVDTYSVPVWFAIQMTRIWKSNLSISKWTSRKWL